MDGSFAQYGSPVEITAPDDRTTQTLPLEATSIRKPKPKHPQFGDRGQFAILAGSRVGIGSSSYSNSDAGGFGVSFEPSVEYFVLRNFSVGVELDASYGTGRSYGAGGSFFEAKNTLVGAALHLGLNVPLADALSIYPLAAFGFHYVQQTYELLEGGADFRVPGSEASLTKVGPWLSVSLPLLYHPAEHFFVGLGPVFYHDFSHAEGGWGGGAGALRSTIGATFVLGGYLDPSEEATAPDEFDPTPRKAPRFGDPGTFVLTEETGISWRSASYAGIDQMRQSFSIAGGLDWFFTRNQSLGLSAFYDNQETPGFPPGPLVTHGTAFGGGVRYGFVLPFYSWFSVYPRMALVYSRVTVDIPADIVSSASSVSTASDVLTASVFVPAMLHLATHFFVGVGPTVSEDIVHTQETGPQTRRTALGASTIIGGWL